MTAIANERDRLHALDVAIAVGGYDTDELGYPTISMQCMIAMQSSTVTLTSTEATTIILQESMPKIK